MNLPTTDRGTFEKARAARPYPSLTSFAADKTKIAWGVSAFIYEFLMPRVIPGHYASGRRTN